MRRCDAMKERLLEFIHCRKCKVDFELRVDSRDPDGEIMTGALTCPRCHKVAPILKGVPRFIEGVRSEDDLRNVYADSFGHQWTTYNWLRDEDEFEFFQITD